MAKQNVAEQFVDILVRAGVKRMYGVVGDSLNPVVDAVRRTPGIDWVHVRHEETAAFAAGAEAQITGQLTACAGSCGPGNLHLINGLYDAHRSMAPVLALASHIPSSEIGLGYFQETHPELLFRECSHYCEMISNPEQMPRLLQTAIQNAIGQGGVSVVTLPGDIADKPAPEKSIESALVTARPSVRPGESEIAKLVEMIDQAEKVTLFCGSGTAGAHDEVMEFAEKLKAPVGHALRGKEWIEYDNPFDVGMSGLLGYGAAYEATHECDLLILLGTDFPYNAFLPDDVKIAQVDVRPEHLGRRSKLDLAIWGDVRETLRCLTPLVRTKSSRRFLDRMLKKHAEALEGVVSAYTRKVDKHVPIHPEYVASVLDDLAADDAIFTVDTGMNNVWAARYITPNGKRRVIGSFSHGSMANALPQAIGAQLPERDRQVVAMAGDGGFSMLMGDFLTLVQLNLPVKVVLFNNSSLGMVELEMLVGGLPAFGTTNHNPDFAAVARACGAYGVRVEKPKQLAGALKDAFKHDGPALVDVVTDPNALSIPPKIKAEMVTGFALSASKMVLDGGVGKMLQMARSNLRNIPRP
ncbi:pyruvate dehydrogenase [Streptomyces albidoflavus]|uniref:pyruvate dehydrogenase n=1 Tax=Streptomyces TaxID=1883 RepID=UPI00101274D4|nr:MULTISPECIES: pyruvate dehydrogenase [Streptomyces]MCU7702365.1 pyruvate dehydrogenase [Streptomyces albidoflavus]RZD87376.1 ubiquinone-dependent pyruvate dehydrogenase [Streptomyces albidoflavus]RZE03420.1 ubiquinone-dependent pyruvate dehydrogenase [Streptomyces albidoflavus]RZE07565.1 ubiquinone-dependent pyruvate dehydrogenase [Streptomyces albidoflavus]RZE08823.1 ubiquinone-dependent pyruvate dehydrogenase [Streptomyces albidoflavus]